VSTYDTLLFLHVLAAAMAVAGVVLYWALFVATGSADARATPVLGLASVADILWAIGGIGVLVLGIALAIQVDAYQVWDGWILAAIVLWMVASESGRRVGAGYRALRAGTGSRESTLWHVVVALAVLALLVDMIYKPGA
jgi:uncharacterized membrane protein